MLDQPFQALFQSDPLFPPEAPDRTKKLLAKQAGVRIRRNKPKSIFFIRLCAGVSRNFGSTLSHMLDEKQRERKICVDRGSLRITVNGRADSIPNRNPFRQRIESFLALQIGKTD